MADIILHREITFAAGQGGDPVDSGDHRRYHGYVSCRRRGIDWVLLALDACSGRGGLSTFIGG